MSGLIGTPQTVIVEKPLYIAGPSIPDELQQQCDYDIPPTLTDNANAAEVAETNMAAYFGCRDEKNQLIGAVKTIEAWNERVRERVEGSAEALNDVIEEETGERPIDEPEPVSEDVLLGGPDEGVQKVQKVMNPSSKPKGRMWYLEIHTWSKEADGGVPGFFHAGPKAITRTYPREHFKHNGECMLHNVKVTKPYYERYKEANGDTRFGSTVFCELVNMDTLTESSPYQAEWHTIGEHLLRQPRGLT